MPFVLFRLGKEQFALDVERVDRVVHVVAVRELPGAPAAVEGVVCVEGVFWPVIDLRQHMGLPPRKTQRYDPFILARSRRHNVVLRVDAVEGVQRIPAEKLTQQKVFSSGIRLVQGATWLEDGTVLIQDLDRLLSQEEVQLLDQAMQPIQADEEGL